MTIINGIEIDKIKIITNEIKLAILNNDPIEPKLNVIMVVSNPCQYARRYILAREFVLRMKQESMVELYIVELTYGDAGFYLTQEKNDHHMQLRTNSSPLWHKENMINLGITMLPSDWKAFAWIDADIEFDDPHWAMNTLKVLNGCRDIVQLWSHCCDMDMSGDNLYLWSSFGYQFTKGRKYHSNGGPNFWHPGYAWAMTRKLYDKCGLYEKSILGNGDLNMALALIGKGSSSINFGCSAGYKQSIQRYEDSIRNARLGYVPGIIRHHYHGSKQNRKYDERWKTLLVWQYDPDKHITYDDNGLIIPSEECPKQLLEDIWQYFVIQNEDDMYGEKKPIL